MEFFITSSEYRDMQNGVGLCIRAKKGRPFLLPTAKTFLPPSSISSPCAAASMLPLSECTLKTPGTRRIRQPAVLDKCPKSLAS